MSVVDMRGKEVAGDEWLPDTPLMKARRDVQGWQREYDRMRELYDAESRKNKNLRQFADQCEEALYREISARRLAQQENEALKRRLAQPVRIARKRKWRLW